MARTALFLLLVAGACLAAEESLDESQGRRRLQQLDCKECYVPHKNEKKCTPDNGAPCGLGGLGVCRGGKCSTSVKFVGALVDNDVTLCSKGFSAAFPVVHVKEDFKGRQPQPYLSGGVVFTTPPDGVYVLINATMWLGPRVADAAVVLRLFEVDDDGGVPAAAPEDRPLAEQQFAVGFKGAQAALSTFALADDRGRPGWALQPATAYAFVLATPVSDSAASGFSWMQCAPAADRDLSYAAAQGFSVDAAVVGAAGPVLRLRDQREQPPDGTYEWWRTAAVYDAKNPTDVFLGSLRLEGAVA